MSLKLAPIFTTWRPSALNGNTFAEVHVIDQWLKDNAAKSGPIYGFNRIKELVAVHAACIKLIEGMYQTSDYESYFQRVKNRVNAISSGNDFNNLKNKMKKLVGNGETIYNFVNAHPNGISSFSQI